MRFARSAQFTISVVLRGFPFLGGLRVKPFLPNQRAAARSSARRTRSRYTL